MIRHGIILALFAAAISQTPTATPAFEGATIKPARPGQRGGSVTTLPRSGRLYVQNYSLVLLVRTAYQVRLEDVTGGPDWRESVTYDIEAKAEQPVDNDQTLFLMLRSLLAERFKLAIHREIRDVPIYALVIGKNGPKLRKVSDQNPAPAARDTAGAGGRGGCGPGTGAYGTLQLGGDAAGARRISLDARSLPARAG